MVTWQGPTMETETAKYHYEWFSEPFMLNGKTEMEVA
jgi:hypothetical protein